MKLKFNEWGWIVCAEFCGNYISRRRFDTKSTARAWLREDKENRIVCAESIA